MSSSTPLPEVYLHPLPRETLLPHLLPLLPITLPIVRRIQFHLQTPYATVLATIPPETSTPSAASAVACTSDPPLRPPVLFAATYLDRSRAPETECWLFSTAEALPPSSAAAESNNTTNVDLGQEQQHASHLLSILFCIAKAPLPSEYPVSTHDTNLLIATAHSTSLRLLKSCPPLNSEKRTSGRREAPVSAFPSATSNPHHRPMDTTDPQPSGSMHLRSENTSGVIRGHTIPYLKFVFAPPPQPPPPGLAPGTDLERSLDTLPLGLTWSRMRSVADFELVIRRTQIPRTVRTLAALPNIAIREIVEFEGKMREETQQRSENAEKKSEEEGTPIGWAFLDPGGALASLHVEPEWRGRGLAKELARRTFGLLLSSGKDGLREMNGSNVSGSEEGTTGGFVGVLPELAFTHSDVARDNLASTGVAKALGGKEAYDCYWILVDLEKVRTFVEE